MSSKRIIALFLLISVIFCDANNQAGAGKATGSKSAAGKSLDTTNQANVQEGITKVRTGDLCDGNPHHADPTTGVPFRASCATCISKAAVEGQSCYLNTWTFRTHCECDSLEFETCHCWRSLHYLGIFVIVVLPFISLATMVIIKVCMKYTFCPMAKMEKELKSMNKHKTKQTKHDTLDETTDGQLKAESLEPELKPDHENDTN